MALERHILYSSKKASMPFECSAVLSNISWDHIQIVVGWSSSVDLAIFFVCFKLAIRRLHRVLFLLFAHHMFCLAWVTLQAGYLLAFRDIWFAAKYYGKHEQT